MATRKRLRFSNPNTSGSTGGDGSPTAIVSDDVGLSDALLLSWISPDDVGFSDALLFTQVPTDALGFSDAISSINASLTNTDDVGLSDVLALQLTESAQAASGSPDSDSWGDGWVNRTAVNAGTHQANTANLQVAAVTAATENDAYIEVNYSRFVSLSAGTTSSTITFVCTWPTVAATPAATLRVDFQSSSGKPFVESTFTANTRARFASASPYTQRSFTFNQDGTQRTHIVTLTSSEVNDILSAKWLMLQFTVPDLTVGTFQIRGRRAADATIALYNLFTTR